MPISVSTRSPCSTMGSMMPAAVVVVVTAASMRRRWVAATMPSWAGAAPVQFQPLVHLGQQEGVGNHVAAAAAPQAAAVAVGMLGPHHLDDAVALAGGLTELDVFRVVLLAPQLGGDGVQVQGAHVRRRLGDGWDGLVAAVPVSALAWAICCLAKSIGLHAGLDGLRPTTSWPTLRGAAPRSRISSRRSASTGGAVMFSALTLSMAGLEFGSCLAASVLVLLPASAVNRSTSAW